jgi:hypothetical protein
MTQPKNRLGAGTSVDVIAPQTADSVGRNFTRDQWFNPHLYPGSERAWKVAREVWSQFRAYPKRKRAMKSEGLAGPGALCAAVVCNVIHHQLSGSPGGGVAVPRAKRELGKKPSRYDRSVFPRSFPKMLDILCDLGFVEQTIGGSSGVPIRRSRTTIRAGAKLLALLKQHEVTLDDLKEGDGEEIIILKRAKRGHYDEGSRIDYRDNAVTKGYRIELQTINEWIASADIRFDHSGYVEHVDVKARRLKRHFTLGRFDRGGRLFGGFWQTLPKDVRLRRSRIEGEAVIGLDFSQLNPMLAYHLARAAPPAEDAYTLPGFEMHRDGVKKIFNAMLFKRHLEKFPKGTRTLFPASVKCSEVTAAIFERHPMLRGVLLSHGIGHVFMFLESKIMMRILERCRARGIIALPVFDCVVVKASSALATEKIMKQEFMVVTGLGIDVKREMPSDIAT